MHKIAFYIDNNRIADVDCSQIADGNPGLISLILPELIQH